MRNKAHPYGGVASPSLLLEEKVARQSRDGCGGKASSQDMLNKCDDRTIPLSHETAQKQAVQTMCNTYVAAMTGWSIANILAWKAN